jgi:predicted Zn-ribbon and HTH transcriptional regulator
MSKPKEAVFVPCGHRQCCYECAADTFKRYKKCPVCSAPITDILKKVFD